MPFLPNQPIQVFKAGHSRIFRDGFFLLCLMLVASLIAYDCDVFPNPPGAHVLKNAIELDEALLLAALLSIGIVIVYARHLLARHKEQRTD